MMHSRQSPVPETSGVTIREFAESVAITLRPSIVQSQPSLPAGNPFLSQSVTGTGEELLDEHGFLHPLRAKITDSLTQFAPSNDIGCLRIIDEGQRPDFSLSYAAQLIAVTDLSLLLVTNGAPYRWKIDPLWQRRRLARCRNSRAGGRSFFRK